MEQNTQLVEYIDIVLSTLDYHLIPPGLPIFTSFTPGNESKSKVTDNRVTFQAKMQHFASTNILNVLLYFISL